MRLQGLAKKCYTSPVNVDKSDVACTHDNVEVTVKRQVLRYRVFL